MKAYLLIIIVLNASFGQAIDLAGLRVYEDTTLAPAVFIGD
jgi:hypothetical protein